MIVIIIVYTSPLVIVWDDQCARQIRNIDTDVYSLSNYTSSIISILCCRITW